MLRIAPLASLAAAFLLGAAPGSAVRLRAGRDAGVHSDGTVHSGERTQRISVRKPLTDNREYVHTTFDSGLRVLAIQDPDAEHSSFAVAVEAGSLEDPPAFQGLAHFCEHMLFLGSKKYPDKDTFSSHLSLHGGTHNAYTSAELTVYFNEVGNEGREKGMDIFAQFFIAPTFDPAMVDKEIHAVDSEHKKNQPDTQRRLWHLLRSKANPKNPMHQFSTGDLRTLKTQPESEGKSLVDGLRKFHNENYCPERLHLVMVSNTSIEEQMLSAHNHFDALRENAAGKTCSPRPVYTGAPAYQHNLGNLGRQITLGTKGAPSMWVIFPMPSLKGEYKKSAESYIWNALGHYGAGSLKALLLKEDLSQSYSFYTDSSVAGSAIFITFSLTEQGAQQTEKILEYLFAYLNAVKSAGVDMKILESIKQLHQVGFDYQEKSPSEFNFVQSVAGSLPQFAPEDVLTGGVLIDTPDKALVEKILESLVPTNMNVALVTPTFNEKAAKYHEEYYAFGYDEEALDGALLLRLAASSGYGFTPPPMLKYVPTNLNLIKENSALDGPEELIKKDRVQLWWLGLGQFQLPKAIISMKLSFPPAVLGNVHDAALSHMHDRLVNRVLEEESDALQTCGLSYSVVSTNDGLSISFSGFDEHLLDLINMVLPKVRSPGNTDSDFENVRRQLQSDVSDVTKLEPYQHAMEAFEVVTFQGHYSRAELALAVGNHDLVNAAAHTKLLDAIFADARLTVLVSGNIDRQRAQEITAVVEETLEIKQTKVETTSGSHLLIVNPKEELEVRIPNPIKDDPNSATLAAFQFGVPNIADRVHISMLGEFIERPVFDALRTERQLGYVVFGYAAPHSSIVEFRVLVQGFRESPDVVDGLIDGVVHNLTTRIADMSQEEFEARKTTLRSTLTKKPRTMGQYSGKFWGQIWDETYCFSKQELMLKHLDSAELSTPKPLLEAWKKAVEPAEGSRKKVVVKLFGAKHAEQSALVKSAESAASKQFTMVDSASVSKQLAGEDFWPHEYVCK